MSIERPFGFIHHTSRETSPTKEATGPVVSGEPFRRRLLIREFSPPEALQHLPKSEKEAFRHLVRAVRRWAQVYSIQEGPGNKAHFYPPRVTENQIIKAADENPQILSPHTVVLREQDGSFSTVPMHEAYSGIIESTNVVGLLKNASNKTKDKKLREYLRAKAKALKDGSWEEADRIWLDREDEPDIDIVLGFYDTYTDKFLGRKYAAEAWAGVLDREATQESQHFLDAFLDNWTDKTGRPRPRVKMRIDETRIGSGQYAQYEWTANSLPCQIELRREVGSKFVIFKPQFVDKYIERAAAFDEHIHPSRRSGIPKSLIWSGTLRRYIGHEIGHSLVEEGIERRIGAHKNWFNELYCDLISLKGYFEIPQVYTHNREHEVAFATHFANGFLDNTAYKGNREREEYFVSSAIVLKHVLDSGHVQAVDGCLVWTDNSAVREAITDLTEEVIELGKNGSAKDVEQFKSRKLDENIYEKVLQTSSNHEMQVWLG